MKFNPQYSRFILFFSVDLENSTAYKQKQQNLNNCKLHSWLPIFIEFYKEFPIILNKNFQSLLGREFPVWKSNGDELLYYYYVRNLKSCIEAINCFYNSIKEYNERQLKKGKRFLLVKGTIWSAGIPLINSLIYPEKYKVDFIGPSIDIGFRLTQFATKNKLVISLEVAYILCLSNHSFLNLKDIYFEGERELKGALDDKPYPVFWLKMEDNTGFFKNQLDIHNINKIDNFKASSYIESYVQLINDESIISLPYIFDKDTNELEFGIVPRDHHRLNNSYMKEIKNKKSYYNLLAIPKKNNDEPEEISYLESEIEDLS